MYVAENCCWELECWSFVTIHAFWYSNFSLYCVKGASSKTIIIRTYMQSVAKCQDDQQMEGRDDPISSSWQALIKQFTWIWAMYSKINFVLLKCTVLDLCLNVCSIIAENSKKIIDRNMEFNWYYRPILMSTLVGWKWLRRGPTKHFIATILLKVELFCVL